MTSAKRSHLRAAVAAAFPHTLPVLTGFLTLGMAYGILMDAAGYGGIYAVLMSAVAFCGSMQFAAISLLTTAFQPVQAFILSLLVNARQLFYGLALLEKYKGLGKTRPFLIYTLCDETFSLASGTEPPAGVSRKYFYCALSLLDYLYWVLGTLLGSVAGSLLTFNTAGLDFALTALFAVLFLEQLEKRENRVYGVLGVACAAVALALLGADKFVIPAMLLLLAVLLPGRNRA